MPRLQKCLSTLAAATLYAVLSNTHAEPIVCRSEAATVKALTIAEPYFQVSTGFQIHVPNLQPLLETDIHVQGPGQSCVVAYFSAVVRPTDNYVVFQVTLDDVPMHGHTLTYPQPLTPVVIEMEETNLNASRMVAHHFFVKVPPGPHNIKVNVAAGSGIDPSDKPTIEAPVLSIHYR